MDLATLKFFMETIFEHLTPRRRKIVKAGYERNKCWIVIEVSIF